MSHTHFRFFAAAALVLAAGCNDCSGKVVPKDQCSGVAGVQANMLTACADTSECDQHYTCSPVPEKSGVQCCTFADRKCNSEADCCPGQTCPDNRKKCFDKYLACEKDADCGDKGDRFCVVYTDSYGTSNRCQFKACGALGECAEGQACFQGECMVDLPCSGACATGEACVPSIDRCQNYASPSDPARAGAACPVTCAPGFIGTFNDNRNIWDSCNLPPVACVCAELPGLRSGDLGRFSAIAAASGAALYVSEYDGQYGDLVVVKYALDGTRQTTEYVDGVPAGAAVKYGPSGARGGVVDPGPDVGRYTDIAFGGGNVYVSYYDFTNGDLKVAVKGAAGTWATHKVDGTTGDVGRYTSIALDSAGNPAVSYFQLGADATFNTADCPAPTPTGPKAFITALKYAHATKAVPTSATDWVVKTVACMSRPTPACYQCNGVCADPGSGPQCLTASTTCAATCDANTQACVDVAGTGTCANKFNPSTLVDVPMGVGVFSSLAFNGNTALIAYMKRNAPASAGLAPDGDLYAVSISAANVAAAPVLIDASGDTGYFPDVKVQPGTNNIGIAYHDFTSKALKYYQAAQLQAGVTPEIIDTGINASSPGEQSWVGTDVGLVFGPSAGQTWVVYQDATKGDLKLAKRATTWTVMTNLSTAGAVGFFADGVFTDGKLYASHAKIHARLVAGEPRVDNSLLLELTTGN